MSDKAEPTTKVPGDKKPVSNAPMPKAKRRGTKGFLTDIRAELKKVTWPSRSEANRLTGVVLTVCIMCVVILYGLSLGFGWILENLFRSRG